MAMDSHKANVFADSHVGLVREGNEDSYGFCHDTECGVSFLIVADGVGGHDRGEVASQLTVQLFLEAWRTFIQSDSFSVSSSEIFLLDTIKSVNLDVFNLNEKLGNSLPMGTTVVVAVILENNVVVGHVGDSRAYVVRNSCVTQVTRDHSYVEELLRSEMISVEEAENHPLGHIITRSVGPVEDVNMDITVFSSLLGDRIVLCTDGLTNHISDDEVAEIVSSSDTPRTAVKKMIVGSLHRGGEDNVTVLSMFL